MRRLLVVGCMVLAGCDDAVVLEVHPAPGITTTSVQLFIGLGTCAECPGIQPPLAPEILPGAVLFREDSNQRTVVRTAKVEDGVALFRIEASDNIDRFDLAVAVDSNGQSAAVIENLPLDTAGRYRVNLLPAGGKLGAKPTADGNFVSIWQQPNGPLSCMGFERWQDGRLQGERIFIVPENDLDCDARPGDECAPFGFDALGVPTIENATCTTVHQLAMDFPVCKIGGPACDDVTGQERACAPTEYCLPERYCDAVNAACTSLVTAFDLQSCLFATDKPPTAALLCTIPFKPASDNTHADICENFAEVDLFPMQAGSVTPVTCNGPDGPLFLEKPATGSALAFDEKVQFTSKDATGTLRTLELEMHHGYECIYKMGLNGEKALGAMVPDDKTVFAQIAVSRNGGAGRKLLLPVKLDFVNDCTRKPSCKVAIDQADSIAACLR